MSIHHTVRVIFKGVWRDLINYKRYKAFFLGWLIELFSISLGFLVIGGAYYFSPEILTILGLKQTDIFLFLMTGSAVATFSGIATWGPLFRVEEDIHFGTLEAIFVTPATRLGYLLSTTISRALVSSIFFLPMYILSLYLAGVLTNPTVIGFTLLIALCTIISLISTGVFFGMLGILFRQTRLLVTVIHQLIQFLCGAYIPVQGYILIHPIIGPMLKYIAMIFPFTYNFDLMRYYMLNSEIMGGYVTLLPIWAEFVILFSSTVLFLILARILLVFVEKKAKQQSLAIL